MTLRRLCAWHGARYAGGAVLCALVNNVILIGGAKAGLPDLAGVLIAWFAGGTTGYFYHGQFTFRQAPTRRSYLQFMSGTALGIPITWVLLLALRQGLGLPMEIAAPTTTVVLVLYNYLNARIALHWGRRKGEAAAGPA